MHDVMPATLDRTRTILARLERHGIRPVTLLVVPDTGWDAASLAGLRELVDGGAELAGHGWRHMVSRIRGPRHRLHSLLISRDVAEHLELDRAGAVDLMRRCHAWFTERGLPTPELYVPPAWAMGDVPRSALDELPFGCYETLGGIYSRRQRRFRILPMVGFEADTAGRGHAVRLWNALNRRAAGSRPLRVAIHPRDFELRLGGDLERLLAAGGRALSYRDLDDSVPRCQAERAGGKRRPRGEAGPRSGEDRSSWPLRGE